MRRLLILPLLLLAAACSTAPKTAVPPVVVIPTAPAERGDLIGLTSGDLIQRFGVPALQVREGTSLKLQFRSNRCILDAYLYPPTSARGAERVMHVDTRVKSGADTDQHSCIATLQGA